MAQSRQASKHNYNKPRLKQQIDDAMRAFMEGGHRVEQVPAMVITEPPSPAAAASLQEQARAEAAAKKKKK